MKHIFKGITALYLFLLIATLFSQSISAAENDTNNEALIVKEATTKLRDFYFKHDYENAVNEGQKFLPDFGGSGELKAWYILNKSRINGFKPVLPLAEKMLEETPGDPWSLFAYVSIAFGEKAEGRLEKSEQAYKLQPNHPDFIWLRANALFRFDKSDNAIYFLDQNIPKVQNPAQLLVTKAFVLYWQAITAKPRDEAKIKLSFDTFDEAKKSDPNCFNAYYLPGSYLFESKNYNDAYALLKQAIALKTNSLSVHSMFWKATTGISIMTNDKKDAEIEADMNELLKATNNNVDVLSAMSAQFANLNLKEKKRLADERILKEYPNTVNAENVLSTRIREYHTGNVAKFSDPNVRAVYLQMLRDFIKRPQHISKQNLSNVCYMLFNETRNDKNISSEELYSTIKGFIQNDKLNPQNSYITGLKVLIERNIYLTEAALMARDGIPEVIKILETRKYSDEETKQEVLNGFKSQIYDLIGWINFKRNRYVEAEKDLIRSFEIDDENEINIYHLGRLYEAMNNLERAQDFYIKGWEVQTEKNPNIEALKTLYQKRNGSLKGYAEFEATVKAKEKEKRQARIIKERILQPNSALPFTLKTLDGKETTFASLKGKIVVVNFWGIWCGWCVKEMPEFQKLSEKYAKDSNVVILTINNDNNTEKVKLWMKTNRYNFNVLLEANSFNSEAQIRSYPTTWFIDKQGRIAFMKKSYTKELLDEFSWRIDELKKGN